MPAGPFSIGKDVQLVIITSSGTLTLPVTTLSFNSKPQFNKIRRVCIDGVVRAANVPAGHEGTIQMDRSDATIDTFFANAEAGYYNGAVNPYKAYIQETITEANGTSSQFKYTPCQLALDDAGEFKGDDPVTQTLSFFASKKIQVA